MKHTFPRFSSQQPRQLVQVATHAESRFLMKLLLSRSKAGFVIATNKPCCNCRSGLAAGRQHQLASVFNSSKCINSSILAPGGRSRFTTAVHASADPGPPELPSIGALSGRNEDVGPVYSLQRTKALVETAMLAAVSGLAFVLATIIRLDTTIGYFLPMPILLATMRSGPASGWGTMMATGFLLVVLLGPLKATSYLLMHGVLAATMGSLWHAKINWWLSVMVLAAVRMAGQLAYLLMSSVTMNENLFALMLNNVYTMLDQVFAALGSSGAPSASTVVCMICGLLLVNGTCYSLILHMIYRIMLQAMGFASMLGPMPGFIRKFLYPSGRDPSDMPLATA